MSCFGIPPGTRCDSSFGISTSQPCSTPPCRGDGTWEPAPGLAKHKFVHREAVDQQGSQAGSRTGVPVAPSLSLEQCSLPGRCFARAVAGNGLIQPIPGSPDVAKPWGSPLQPAQHSLLPSPLFTRCWGWRMKRLFPAHSPPHPSPAPVPEPGCSHAG